MSSSCHKERRIAFLFGKPVSILPEWYNDANNPSLIRPLVALMRLGYGSSHPCRAAQREAAQRLSRWKSPWKQTPSLVLCTDGGPDRARDVSEITGQRWIPVPRFSTKLGFFKYLKSYTIFQEVKPNMETQNTNQVGWRRSG